MCRCPMSSQAIGFILCAQQYLLFSPCKTKKTKEKHIECYLEMNQLHKPMSFSPCRALGWSCRLAGAVCTGCSTAHSPSCSPHRQHYGGSQWVPGTQPASGLRAETPPERLLLGTAAVPVTCLPVSSQCGFVEEAEGLVQQGATPKCVSQWVLGFMLRGQFAPALARQQLVCTDWCTPSPCSPPAEVFSLENGSINTFTSQGKQQPS